MALGMALIAALALALVGPACNSRASKGATTDDAAVAPPLPSITVRDDSRDLTFSFVTLDGGFRTARTVAEVPYEARDAVRVWNDVSGDGVAGPWVYVADLRNRLGDGTYKVDSMPRAQFDDLAVDRRKKAKEALAVPKPATAPTAPTALAGPGQGSAPGGAAKSLVVIIYGADWCKPCHQAEDYLKSKGIAFVHKDIEDPNINEELADKLMGAGLQTHSIPIIDVRGKLLVGFDPGALDRAIDQALGKG